MRRDLIATRRTRPSLTPLIDVVFLLLIFFMIVSKPMKDQQYDLTLSGQGQSTASKVKEKTLDIKLQLNEKILYDGKIYSLDDFKEQLKNFKNHAALDQQVSSDQAGLKIQIYLTLEGGVTLQETVKVMETLQIDMPVKVSLVTEEALSK